MKDVGVKSSIYNKYLKYKKFGLLEVISEQDDLIIKLRKKLHSCEVSLAFKEVQQ